jgi:hypothetical protein
MRFLSDSFFRLARLSRPRLFRNHSFNKTLIKALIYEHRSSNVGAFVFVNFYLYIAVHDMKSLRKHLQLVRLRVPGLLVELLEDRVLQLAPLGRGYVLELVLVAVYVVMHVVVVMMQTVLIVVAVGVQHNIMRNVLLTDRVHKQLLVRVVGAAADRLKRDTGGGGPEQLIARVRYEMRRVVVAVRVVGVVRALVAAVIGRRERVVERAREPLDFPLIILGQSGHSGIMHKIGMVRVYDFIHFIQEQKR